MVWTQRGAINLVFVSAKGKAGPRRQLFPANKGYSSHVSLLWSGDQFGLFWQYWDRHRATLQVGKISAAGAVVAHRKVDETVESPSVVWNGASYCVAWRNESQVLFGLFSWAGTLRILSTVASEADLRCAPKLVWRGGEYGFAWTERQTANRVSYFARLSPAGKMRSKEQLGPPSHKNLLGLENIRTMRRARSAP